MKVKILTDYLKYNVKKGDIGVLAEDSNYLPDGHSIFVFNEVRLALHSSEYILFEGPQANNSTPIAYLVMEDILKRKEIGQKKYGVPLQANNGRNALQDLYEELLDAAHYIKQKIVEMENE